MRCCSKLSEGRAGVHGDSGDPSWQIDWYEKQGLRNVQSKNLPNVRGQGGSQGSCAQATSFFVLRLGVAAMAECVLGSFSSGPTHTLLCWALLLSSWNAAASVISPWKKQWHLLSWDEQWVRRFRHQGANTYKVTLPSQVWRSRRWLPLARRKTIGSCVGWQKVLEVRKVHSDITSKS